MKWIILLLLASCDWRLHRMNDQPKCLPGERTDYLPDERCDQAPPPNTVAWHAPLAPPPEPAPTRALIARGADRFRRFCSPCHGALGDGNSVIAKDMVLRKPPSLHSALVAGYPDQRLFETITSGYGMMPAYGPVLEPADRWAIVHFVRVLEKSQSIALDALPPAQQEEARPWLR